MPLCFKQYWIHSEIYNWLKINSYSQLLTHYRLKFLLDGIYDSNYNKLN